MAGTSDIRAGAAYVELYAKGSFSKDLADAQKKLKAFGDNLMKIGKQMLGIGVAISAPLVLAVQQFATMGDAVNKASQRTGIAVEMLSALKYAAEQSSVGFEELETGIRKMEKTIFDAADGSQAAEKALASLGLTAAELKGLSPEREFTLIAEHLSQITDEGTRAAVTLEIFGRGGAALIPLLSQGAGGILAMTRHAKDLGIVMSKEDAEAATTFADTMKDLNAQFHAFLFTVGSVVAQVLQPFADGAVKIMRAVIDWTKAHRNLVIAVILGAAAFLSAGAALIGLALAVKAVVIVSNAVVTVFGAISAAIAFLLNPIVLVGLGLAALGSYFAYTSGYIGEAIDWLKNKFSELSATFTTILGGIADALAAGDIPLAAQILWVGLQTAWAQGTYELNQKWLNFKYGFLKVAIDAFYGVQEEWETAKAALVTSWDNMVSLLGDIFDGFISYFGNAWDTMTSNIAKGILYVQSLWDGSDYNQLAKAADDQLATSTADRDSKAQKRIADRAAKLQTDLADVEKKKDSALKDLANKNVALDAGADQASKDELAGLEKKKQELQNQLKALRDQSSKEKKTADDSKPPSLVKPDFNLDELLGDRKAISAPAKSNGLFNIAALQSLQSTASDDYMKQTAKYTQETAKNTRKNAQFAG